jgi:hypothetical protein
MSVWTVFACLSQFESQFNPSCPDRNFMILLTISVEKLKSFFEPEIKAFVQIFTDSSFSPQMINHMKQHH